MQKRNEMPINLLQYSGPPTGPEYPGQRSRSRATEPSRGKTEDLPTLPRTRLMGIVGIKIRPAVIG